MREKEQEMQQRQRNRSARMHDVRSAEERGVRRTRPAQETQALLRERELRMQAETRAERRSMQLEEAYENEMQPEDTAFAERPQAQRSDAGRRRQGERGVRETSHTAAKRTNAGAGHAANRRRGKRKSNPVWRRLLTAVLALALVFVAYSFIKPYLGERYWTVAVFGVDSRDGNLGKGALADVQMVCSIDRRSGDIRIVSVFRDTYSKINKDGDYHKLNEAYFKGGYEQALWALEENLDLEIDDYVSFNWGAVAHAIDALGGVDLELSEAEAYFMNAFIHETCLGTGISAENPAAHYIDGKAGMQHLDGVQAVAYGRLRLMDTDFNRTARQRKVIGLAMDKAKTAGAGTLVKLAKAILPEVSTSIGLGDITEIARNIKKYNIAESTGFPFARETMRIRGMDCVVPETLASNVVTLHQLLYGTENYTPSGAVQEISAHIGEVSGLTEAGENAPEAGTGGGVKPKGDKGQSGQKEETAVPETEVVTEESSESAVEDSSEAMTESDAETESSAAEDASSESSEEDDETVHSSAAEDANEAETEAHPHQNGGNADASDESDAQVPEEKPDRPSLIETNPVLDTTEPRETSAQTPVLPETEKATEAERPTAPGGDIPAETDGPGGPRV